MNPKTGEILAMAASGGFDPNDSREPEGKTAKAKFAKLSSKEKLKYLNNMWRNPMQDLDDPGYGWASNKGYGSAAHMRAIAELGVSDHHRRSWKMPTQATK